MEKLWRSLGRQINGARKARGISVDQLAEEVGISTGFAWQIIGGSKGPSLKTLLCISGVLDIPISSFFLSGEEHLPPSAAELTSIVQHIDEENAAKLLTIVKAILAIRAE